LKNSKQKKEIDELLKIINLLKNLLIDHQYDVVLYLLIEFYKNDDHNLLVQVIDYLLLMVLLHNLCPKEPNQIIYFFSKN